MSVVQSIRSLVKRPKQPVRSAAGPTAVPGELAGHGFHAIDDFRPEDIFIVGFPKSGNTWMQNLVAGVQYGIDTQLLADRLTQVLVPNVHGCQVYKRLTETTCFKSHTLPRPDYRRVVYLVRDGRDAMVSYWHMNQCDPQTAFAMRDMVENGMGLFPCKWHEHVNGWLDNPYDAEMLIVRYEDLHADPLGQLQRFCRFAGIERDLSTLLRSIEGNSFDRMQAKEESFGWDNSNWNPEHRFIRKGVIGSYRSEMPVELVRIFEAESANALRRCGYPLTDD